MKSRFILAVAFLCGIATFAKAVEAPDGRMIATVVVSNEDSTPHSVTIDPQNNTIRIFAGPGGGGTLPPGQEVAQRAHHGVWRIFGDSGREMQVRFHRGRDYKLHLRPYTHENVSTLVGTMDDGYNHYSVPLATLKVVPVINQGGPIEYNPGYHNNYHGEDGYQYHRTDSKESLGHAIHEAFNQFLHNIGDQNQGTPQYQQQYEPEYVTPW